MIRRTQDTDTRINIVLHRSNTTDQLVSVNWSGSCPSASVARCAHFLFAIIGQSDRHICPIVPQPFLKLQGPASVVGKSWTTIQPNRQTPTKRRQIMASPSASAAGGLIITPCPCPFCQSNVHLSDKRRQKQFSTIRTLQQHVQSMHGPEQQAAFLAMINPVTGSTTQGRSRAITVGPTPGVGPARSGAPTRQEPPPSPTQSDAGLDVEMDSEPKEDSDGEAQPQQKAGSLRPSIPRRHRFVTRRLTREEERVRRERERRGLLDRFLHRSGPSEKNNTHTADTAATISQSSQLPLESTYAIQNDHILESDHGSNWFEFQSLFDDMNQAGADDGSSATSYWLDLNESTRQLVGEEDLTVTTTVEETEAATQDHSESETHGQGFVALSAPPMPRPEDDDAFRRYIFQKEDRIMFQICHELDKHGAPLYLVDRILAIMKKECKDVSVFSQLKFRKRRAFVGSMMKEFTVPLPKSQEVYLEGLTRRDLGYMREFREKVHVVHYEFLAQLNELLLDPFLFGNKSNMVGCMNVQEHPVQYFEPFHPERKGVVDDVHSG